MEIERKTAEFARLNWAWIGVNIASWLLSEFLYDQLGSVFFFTSIGFAPILIATLVVALGQWLYLRRFFEKIGWWLPATVVGLSVSFFTLEIQGIAGGYGMATIILIGVLLGWLLVGTLQWLVLRTHLPRAGWWILGSTVGLFLNRVIVNLAGVLGLAILFGVNRSDVVTLNSSTTVFNLILIAVVFLGSVLGYGVYGWITGYVLYRLSAIRLQGEGESTGQEA